MKKVLILILIISSFVYGSNDVNNRTHIKIITDAIFVTYNLHRKKRFDIEFHHSQRFLIGSKNYKFRIKNINFINKRFKISYPKKEIRSSKSNQKFHKLMYYKFVASSVIYLNKKKTYTIYWESIDELNSKLNDFYSKINNNKGNK